MKKWTLLLGIILATVAVQAASLPNNIYMKAMKDEIKRSMAKLRRPGVEKPYFIAYKLEQLTWGEEAVASFGAPYSTTVRDSQLNAYAWVDIGNAQKDSMGFAHAAYYAPYAYRPRSGTNLPKSYDGIRHTLWQLTDRAYTFAAETYQQKQAYERSKQTDKKDSLPDVIPAKQVNYVEEINPLPVYDANHMRKWVKEQSVRGKEYPFIEQFTVSVSPVQKDSYYLNSKDGFYQKSIAAVQVEWQAQIRNRDGFKRKYGRTLWLPDFSSENKALAATYTDGFLEDLQAFNTAVKGESYIGPVLLMPEAAGRFIYEELVQNFQNLKGLASDGEAVDTTMGKFSIEGQRVMAPGITVWDEPLRREANGIPLGGFTPVDDEGVAAQTLKLVEQGRVVDLPRTTRPLDDKKPSNGHALITHQSMPRERLSNVWVEPAEPLAWDDLVSTFLDRCRELDLEYGYVLHQWPGPYNENLPVWERVYLDGTSEFVYGLKIDGLTTRSLRDILAAGDSPVISHIDMPGEVGLPAQNVDTPALLIEEMELITVDGKPDKEPFVKKP
ncbi:MAG: hypothetical protein IJ876_01120 [Elusimicrobiaceae bacterium]|nr:hypothetical protein [Elusimicrobiaceae bacterium]